ACRHGHVQHLEHLLFYGADMSAQNASGNTALHICALYNQLLYRGASHILVIDTFTILSQRNLTKTQTRGLVEERIFT
ncbi:SH3 and multiple ankyrin repeat domains protein 3-like isoform X6, partial [Tachysurus ichikawai]